jgi:hypothetical protein
MKKTGKAETGIAHTTGSLLSGEMAYSNALE